MATRLLQEPGLADTRLAYEQKEPASGVAIAVEEALDRGPLTVATEERRASRGGAPEGTAWRASRKQAPDVDSLLEDRLLQRTQLLAGLDTEFLAEGRAGPLVSAERVGLASGPVESNHQQPPQPLAQGVGGYRGFQRRHRGVVTAGRDLGFQLQLERQTP